MSILSNLFKKKEESAEVLPRQSDLTLVAPLSGTVIPLTDVPDPVISERIMGEGLALIPDQGSSQVLAPCEGIISRLLSSHNAFALKTPSGVELYLSFGLGLSNLTGQGFESSREVGERVMAGDEVLRVDLGNLPEETRYTLLTMIVVRSSADISKVSTVSGHLTGGQSECVWVELKHEEKDKSKEKAG